MLELFPESAEVRDGELVLGGVPASQLAAEHGTPLLVYCERTIRSQVRAYREAAPDALVVYGTKAFANVALLRLLAEEGVGAGVSTLGELAFALAAGIEGPRLVFHGNNKSLEELRGAAGADRPRGSGGRGGTGALLADGGRALGPGGPGAPGPGLAQRPGPASPRPERLGPGLAEQPAPRADSSAPPSDRTRPECR